MTTLTNILIVYKLGLVPGFKYFTLYPDSEQVVFHKAVQIPKLVLGKSKVTRLESIVGETELRSHGARISILNDRIEMAARKGLEIIDSENGQTLYPFDLEKMPITSIKSLSVPKGLFDVKYIRSPTNEDLRIVSNRNVRFRGNQGVRIEGKHVDMSANDLIFLSSVNGSIILDGQEGVYLNMNSFRDNLVNDDDDDQKNNSSELGGEESSPKWQFKLCICGRNGQLFRIAVKDQLSSCADARFPQSENPCL